MIYWSEGQGIFDDVALRQELTDKHKIYCRNVGLNTKSRQSKQFCQPPFLVDRFALAYIYQHKLAKVGASPEKIQQVLDSSDYKVYCKYKSRYFLLDGAKFGSTFLAYEGNPDSTHAQLLIFTNGGLVDASRLATIAKKQCIYVDPTTLQSYRITFQGS